MITDTASKQFHAMRVMNEALEQDEMNQKAK